MRTLIETGSDADLVYGIHEINRPLVGDSSFLRLDGAGIISTAIAVARQNGRVSVLDAGCGTGIGLIGLKDQISLRAPVAPEAVEAVGVSLTEFGEQPDWDWEDKKRRRNGYIDYRVGHLATLPLEPEHFEVAYSYQVLLHNASITPIINNILPSLAAGGAFYFDIADSQQVELDELAASLDPAAWELRSVSVTRDFSNGPATRTFNKLTRPQ